MTVEGLGFPLVYHQYYNNLSEAEMRLMLQEVSKIMGATVRDPRVTFDETIQGKGMVYFFSVLHR